MSSREIAELVGSRHDKVRQSIERLVERDVIDLPPMGEDQIETSHGRKHSVQVYFLDERSSYIVVAQLSPEFTARLVDEWKALKERVGRPARLTGPQLMAAALIEANATMQAQAQQIEGFSIDGPAAMMVTPHQETCHASRPSHWNDEPWSSKGPQS